jgi:hypothetical protein
LSESQTDIQYPDGDLVAATEWQGAVCRSHDGFFFRKRTGRERENDEVEREDDPFETKRSGSLKRRQ